MEYLIYLVEDELKLNRLLTTYLAKEGWQVKSFLTGEEARTMIAEKPHLWILDIMLPDIDGYQLIDEIKAIDPDIPVIFVSARDAELDRIIGLERGSDDYLAKPFSPRELVLRTRKILERVYANVGQYIVYKYGSYTILPQKRSVTDSLKNGLDLTAKEFDLLLFFVENVQLALTRDQILDRVWGEDYYGTDRVVDDTIRRLRKKIPDLRIETIYGLGYRLVNL